MRTALYLRASTDKQDTSVSQQCVELERYARDNGLTVVVAYFDQGISGSTADRPGFQALIEDARRGGFECALVYDRSRWGRFPDALEAVYWEMELKRQGVALKAMREAFTDDLVGSIMRLITDWKADQERRDILTRLQRGRTHNTRGGYWVKGRPPYGYRLERVKDGRHTRSVLVEGRPEEVEAVRRIFHLHNSGRSMHQIAEHMTGHIPTPNGKYRWQAETVRRILENPVYKGRLTFNGNKWGGAETEGACLALIQEEPCQTTPSSPQQGDFLDDDHPASGSSAAGSPTPETRPALC